MITLDYGHGELVPRRGGVWGSFDSLLALLTPFTNHKLDCQKLSCRVVGHLFLQAARQAPQLLMSQYYPKFEPSKNENTCCGCQKKLWWVSGKKRHPSKIVHVQSLHIDILSKSEMWYRHTFTIWIYFMTLDPCERRGKCKQSPGFLGQHHMCTGRPNNLAVTGVGGDTYNMVSEGLVSFFSYYGYPIWPLLWFLFYF